MDIKIFSKISEQWRQQYFSYNSIVYDTTRLVREGKYTILSGSYEVRPPFLFNRVVLHLNKVAQLGLGKSLDKGFSFVRIHDPWNTGLVSSESMFSGRVL